MNKKIIVYVVIILLVIIAIFYFFNINKSQNSGTPPYQAQIPTTSTVTPFEPVSPIALPVVNIPTTSTPSAVISRKIYNVAIDNFSFNPATININKGDTIIWTNQDSVPHQIWSDTFNGPIITNGQTYSFIFNNVGTYNYHCNIHPSMTGSIVVN